MSTAVNRRRLLAVAPLAALALAVVALAAWRLTHPPNPPPDAAALADWDVPRLADELGKRGMALGVSPDATPDGDQLAGGAMLYDRSRNYSGAAAGAGSIYVTRDDLPHQERRRFFSDAPEAGQIGPFHFRGDADFFRRIEAALR